MSLFSLFKSSTTLATHVLVWGVLFAVPLLYAVENAAAVRFALRNSAMLCGLMLTFYSNYLWGIDKLLFKRHYWRFFLFNVAVFVIVVSLRSFVNSLIDAAEGMPAHHGRHDGMISLFVFNDIVFSLLVICASFGVKHIAWMRQIEMERRRLENETLTSELSLLRYQIQPHFFFNCLNNIYSLIGSSPKEAQKAVHSLSKMMRFVLYDSGSNILLSKDIEFLKNYISLMRLRLSKQASVSFSFPEETGGISVPPLLFIPLVENAFKHGVGAGCDADVSCVMELRGERLNFCVRNKFVRDERNEDRSHSGIGLVNLRKRLDILYGDNYKLRTSAEGDTDGLFCAEIEIPVQDTEKPE